MSLQNSIDFIISVSADNDFRNALNGLPLDDFYFCLKECGYDFTADEFEESVNLLHVKCQHEEQANKLFEIVSWYRLVTSQN